MCIRTRLKKIVRLDCWMNYIQIIKRFALLTWTLDSGKLIFSAASSRIKMSGYRVLLNKDSNMSSCARVNVVRSRRCLRWFAESGANKIMWQKFKFYEFIAQ